ncbi:MAG: 2-amino-4-hydroxy-6-hydroxymethyldihydropteridine diphosphokinase [Myxococcales bacterium]|nr:2-amino-4-hydroxy-6-hydroxymethyldihydropteridine diphosphokinase [Myxococcales bacterium]
MSHFPHRTFVGLGSNLGDREAQLHRACDAMRQHPRMHLSRLSSVRETAPWGLTQQPHFLNAVAEVYTDLSPEPLLDALKDIERRLGRSGDALRWGPRAIDLDILLFDDLVFWSPRLQIPHAQLLQREFVLVPLFELAPGLRDPQTRRFLADCLRELAETDSSER